MSLLRDLGVIEFPTSEGQWSSVPNVEQTHIEQWQWRYRWNTHLRSALLPALEDYLDAVPRDDYGLALRLQLWEELAIAEAQRFFEQQLAKNRFEPNWARDLIFVHRDTRPALSIGQWRYVCWAAVRHGASIAHRQPSSELATVREAIFTQLRRRAGYVGSGTWTNCSFPPINPLPDSALGRLFTTRLARFGSAFWTEVPSAEAFVFSTGPAYA